MKFALLPIVYSKSRPKLKKSNVTVLSVFYHYSGSVKPKQVYELLPGQAQTDVYTCIYELRDAGYVQLVRKPLKTDIIRVSGLYRITPKGRKFMEDFVKEMEAIAERLEHGY